MKLKPTIRRAATSDVLTVVELIREYAAEVFQQVSNVTPEALLNDGFGSVFEFMVADAPNGELVGFAAWEKTYDIVAGTRGGALLGLYVCSDHRDNGIGDALLAAIMREVSAIGGNFVVGLDDERTELSDSARPTLRVSRIQSTALKHQAADLALLKPERAAK